MNVQDTGIAAVIGTLLPLLISVVVQFHWGDQLKAVVAFLLCVVAAALGSFFTGAVDLASPDWNWVTWFGTIYGAAMIAYARFWRPTRVAPQIEFRTTLDKSKPGDPHGP